MSHASQKDDRSNPPPAGLEARLRRAAGSFAYPPTPELAARERQRVAQQTASRLDGSQQRPLRPGARPAARPAAAWVVWALAALALLASLVMVSPARARVAEWLRIGAVRIFLEGAPAPTANALPLPAALADLAGETSLAEAADRAPFTPRLPAYPPDLGQPQRVYFQQARQADILIFVWQQPHNPQEVRLALYQISGGDAFQKQLVGDVQETTVNGAWAVWVEGPYLLTTRGGQVEERRIVRGRTLIWFENELTYRLESDLPLDEARRIAESLRAWPPQ